MSQDFEKMMFDDNEYTPMELDACLQIKLATVYNLKLRNMIIEKNPVDSIMLAAFEIGMANCLLNIQHDNVSGWIYRALGCASRNIDAMSEVRESIKTLADEMLGQTALFLAARKQLVDKFGPNSDDFHMGMFALHDAFSAPAKEATTAIRKFVVDNTTDDVTLGGQCIEDMLNYGRQFAIILANYIYAGDDIVNSVLINVVIFFSTAIMRSDRENDACHHIHLIRVTMHKFLHRILPLSKEHYAKLRSREIERL